MAKKSISKMTIKELKKEIKRMTEQVKTMVKEYGEPLPQSAQVLYENLIKLGGSKRGDLIAGLSGKNKPLLTQQARELDYFMDYDFNFDMGRQLDERAEMSWQEFVKNNPNWQKEEWQDLVEFMGTQGKEVLEGFGYKDRDGNGHIQGTGIFIQFYEEYKSASNKENLSFGLIIQDVLKNYKGDQKGMITAVWDKLYELK